MAYCIAFSAEGATDVTRRYVRNPNLSLPRNRCPEEVLLWIVHEIRKIRRGNLSKEAQTRLRREDDREERELRRYVARALTSDLISQLPDTAEPYCDEDSKTAAETPRSLTSTSREAAARQTVPEHQQGPLDGCDMISRVSFHRRSRPSGHTQPDPTDQAPSARPASFPATEMDTVKALVEQLLARPAD